MATEIAPARTEAEMALALMEAEAAAHRRTAAGVHRMVARTPLTRGYLLALVQAHVQTRSLTQGMDMPKARVRA